MLVGVSLWLVVQQAHQRDAMEADLKELAGLQESARWAEARAALERAEAQLGRGRAGRPAPAARPGPARPRPGDPPGQHPAEAGDSRRARILQGASEPGLRGGVPAGGAGSEPRSAVVGGGTDQRIGACAGHLWRQCYDWAVCAADKVQRGWLLEVARQTDSSSGRLARARSRSGRMGESRGAGGIGPDCAGDAASRSHCCWRSGNGSGQPAGTRPPCCGGCRTTHPADFWANLILGNAMLQRPRRKRPGTTGRRWQAGRGRRWATVRSATP